MSRSHEERIADILEAATESALSDACRDGHLGIAWRDIAALRVLLAHRYHRIDPDQVWQIATASVPDLADRLRA